MSRQKGSKDLEPETIGRSDHVGSRALCIACLPRCVCVRSLLASPGEALSFVEAEKRLPLCRGTSRRGVSHPFGQATQNVARRDATGTVRLPQIRVDMHGLPGTP